MDREIDPRLTTRHFDLLMAACIAYQMRNFVRAPENRTNEFDPWLIQRQEAEEKNPAR